MPVSMSMIPGTPMPAPTKRSGAAILLGQAVNGVAHFADDIVAAQATLTPRVIFSSSWPSVVMAAIRKLVPPRSTPIEKSGMTYKVNRMRKAKSILDR